MLPIGLIIYRACSLDEKPEKRFQFDVLFVILNSSEGKLIRHIQSGSEYGFDELDADIRDMLPSSRFRTQKSSRASRAEFESRRGGGTRGGGESS
jgi:hypothetical protein